MGASRLRDCLRWRDLACHSHDDHLPSAHRPSAIPQARSSRSCTRTRVTFARRAQPRQEAGIARRPAAYAKHRHSDCGGAVSILANEEAQGDDASLLQPQPADLGASAIVRGYMRSSCVVHPPHNPRLSSIYEYPPSSPANAPSPASPLVPFPLDTLSPAQAAAEHGQRHPLDRLPPNPKGAGPLRAA